jgi:signal transduction histidine kinase
VRHVAEAHGGRVTVASRPGEGSRFTLWFPLS